jgi:hypothetical protein
MQQRKRAEVFIHNLLRLMMASHAETYSIKGQRAFEV